MRNMQKTAPKKAKPVSKKKKEATKCVSKKCRKEATGEDGENGNDNEHGRSKNTKLLQRIFTFGNFQPHRAYLEKVLPQYSSPLEFSIQNLSFHESTLSSIIETDTFDLILDEMSNVEGITRPLLIICLEMNHFRDKRISHEIFASLVTLHERAHTRGIQTICLEIPSKEGPPMMLNSKAGAAREEALRMDVNHRIRFWSERKQAQNMMCFIPFPRCDTTNAHTISCSSPASKTDNSSSAHYHSTPGISTRQADKRFEKCQGIGI